MLTHDGFAIAQHFTDNPADLLEVLSLLSISFEDEAALLRFCDAVALQHTGSIDEQTVAPFLRVLTERLFHAEAGMGIRS